MNPYLSYVTGTYNRLGYLKQLVDSVRASISTGIPYEIVLVDGGSTDGTIEWCKAQHDIVLIEQGKLLGAIKAFNAGCRAARGEYVVIGNDDILILDETLLCAIEFMQSNPDVGVGCFYQDRAPMGPWHVELMPGIVRGRQTSIPYGQVCIVPRWLGDKVGWWGNTGARTYGGDNELSCNVYELGYRVAPCCEWKPGSGTPWAAITDLKADDDLRRINTQGSQDGNIWGRKWRRRVNGRRMAGPVVQETPQVENPIKRKMRFLYLPIYEQGHAIQKSQKRGLREALAWYGLVVELDYMELAAKHGGAYMRNYVMDVADVWKPDLFLFQIHTPNVEHFLPEHIADMKREYGAVPMVNWNGDYHPQDLFSSRNIALAKEFDLQLVVTTAVAERYRRGGVNWKYWQIGYEESEAMPDETTRAFDVVFLANGYSPERKRLGMALKGNFGRADFRPTVGIFGSWPDGLAAGYSLYNFDEGAKTYRAAKISIGDDQWGAPGFVSNRLFQAMSAGGAMYMQKRVPALEQLLGLVDGTHYIAWNNTSDLLHKIEYWLRPENEQRRAAIARQGQRLMMERHTFRHRVQELIGWL
jgi:glycosyltransferase involved in cell wall biosynthesis